MDGYTDDYLDALKDIAAEYKARPYVALEQRVDFSEYVSEGFGTADCIMIGAVEGIEGDVLNVIDFKYGKGVEVEAENNPQMMLYALGAVMDYMSIYDIFTVRMTIVQPRIKREPETWEMEARELFRWANTVVEPAAKLAAKGEGEYSEGEWCRFCTARGSCRARAEANLQLARMDFRQPPELTDAEVAEALETGQRLKQWLSDLEAFRPGGVRAGRVSGGPGAARLEGRGGPQRAGLDRSGRRVQGGEGRGRARGDAVRAQARDAGGIGEDHGKEAVRRGAGRVRGHAAGQADAGPGR